MDRNIQFKVIPNDYKMMVENSLHKYYKGVNYDDFTYSDIVEASDSLANLTGISLR